MKDHSYMRILDLLKKFGQIYLILGFVLNTNQLQKTFSASDENTETNEEEQWEEIKPIHKHRFLLPFIIAVVLIITAVFGLGIHLLTKTSSPLFPRPNKTYNCVNGSTHKIQLDNAWRPLVELNIQEQYPTLIVGNVEYLLVPRVSTWWYAQTYCTAWCGYLVSIKRQEENAMILGTHKLI